MNKPSKLARVALVLATVFVLGACAQTATPTTVQNVDTNSIVATVVAEVQAQQPVAAATPDPGTLEATVRRIVSEQLTALESSRVAELVKEAIATQQTTPVNLTNAASTATTTELEATLEQVYRAANPAVVYIIVPNVGSGSGFVYDKDGHIVTNNHVVAGGSSFEVVFANGERMSATLVGSDTDSDLAVLKVASLPAGVTPLPLASQNLQVGQFVVAIGNPFGEQGSMSMGIVSGLDRDLRSQRSQNARTAYSLPSVIQTDAPINPGNSGGPLLNLAGEVVGINSQIASTTGVNSGVGFAIPVAAVTHIVPDLISQGKHTYSYLGASFDDEISLSDQSQLGLPQTQGAYLVSVTTGGPADRAGLIAANAQTGRGGDLVVKVDGQAVQSFADLNSYLVFNTGPGQTIQLTVLRNGKEVVVPLTLGVRP